VSVVFRFLHAADLHLDSPFGGLSEAAPPGVAAAVRRATLGSWRRIVELAVAERVDFVLVAGDVFDSDERTIRGQLAFVDGLRALDGAGIPSFVVTGNHDPLSGWEPSLAWPAGAYRFAAAQVESRPVVRDGVEIARVHGISYGVRDVRENLASRFRKEPGSPFAIGLLHANVGGQPGHENYAPCSVGDLVGSGMDYWALGHVHRPQVLREAAPTIVYAGNPQGRDAGELEPRGAMLVSVDRTGRAEVELRELDEIRWVHRAIDIAEFADLEALLGGLERELDAARAGAGRPVIARIELTGFGRLHAELQRPDAVRDLRERLVDRLASREPFAWLADLHDATRPEEARAIARAGDFLGELEAVVGFALARAGVDPSAPGDADAAVVFDVDAVIDELFASPQVAVAARSKAIGQSRLRRPDATARADLLLRAHRRIVDELAGRE
jgi:exonuclease SbcD